MYTKKKWQIVPTIDGRKVIAIINDLDEVDVEIAEMVPWNAKSNDEQFNNSVLIAAAPKMYEALLAIAGCKDIKYAKQTASAFINILV